MRALLALVVAVLVPVGVAAQPVTSGPMTSVPVTNEPVATQAIVHAGTPVLVEWHGSWYDGHVVATSEQGAVRIHYEGYGDGDDETVSRNRLRFGRAQRPTAVGSTSNPPAGRAITMSSPLACGETVLVNYRGAWWRANVTAVLDDGSVAVHYDGFTHANDEIVPRDRLLEPRPDAPPAGAIETLDARQVALAIGASVEIEWSGAYYPGRVIAILDDGQLRVHWTGWSNDNDATVPRARVRVRAAR